MQPKTNIRQDANSVEVSYSDPEVKGYIHAERDPDNPKIYRVNRVDVTPKGKGYGKRLYKIAMDIVTDRGGVLAPAKKYTSDSAMNVWRSLYRSGDVDKSSLSSGDWGVGPRHDKMMKAYPGLRFSDVKTHPPSGDSEFWTANSGYRSRRPVGASEQGSI